MLIKIVVLFLVALIVLAMFGQLRLGRQKRGKDLPPKPRRCPSCGSYVIGSGRCRCEG